MKTRATLAVAMVAGALLAGCAPTPTARPPSAVNPRLTGLTGRLPAGASAADLAHAIATGWAAPDAPAGTPGGAIEFTSVDYTASVFNPDLASGYTAFVTLRRRVRVTPASAATIDITNAGPPTFATPTDQALWTTDHRPSLGQAPPAGQRMALPAGEFSFIPQGSTLTYAQAVALPGEPGRLAATLVAHLRPYAGTEPPASLELKQLGYLIATAPLTDTARSAAWAAVAALPGLRTCARTPGGARAGTADLCVDTPTEEARVTVDTVTGAVLAVADRIRQPSPMYPHVPAGGTVDSSTFVAG